MLVSRDSPGVSHRCDELSEGASDENAMAREAAEGPLTGPDAVLISRVNARRVQTTDAATLPPSGILSRATGIRNGVDHNELRQTWRYR